VRRLQGIAPCQQWYAESAAAQPLAHALALHPNHEGARLNAARLSWLLGDCEKALDEWRRFGAGDPVARLELANGLLALGREEEALDLYREMEDAAKYLRLRGEEAEAAQDTDAAVVWYEYSMEVQATLTTARSLASAYAQTGRPEAAREVWRKLGEEATATDQGYWWAVGQNAERVGDWEVATRAYERGAEVARDPCEFWERQSAALVQLEEWASAESLALQAMGACSSALWPYLRLGTLHRGQGDQAGALHWYQQAKTLWPEHFAPKFYIGEVYFEREQYERAAPYFQQALVLNPSHLLSMHRIAWCRHYLRDDQSAVEVLAHAVELHTGKPWSWAVDLGDWQVQLGRYEEALAAYRLALSWRPENESILTRIQKTVELSP